MSVDVKKRFDVTVVGELNLDLILYGLPEALPPERELLASGLALTLGSSSAIFAHNLSRLGSRVGFVTRIGTDPLGEIACERLAEGGVDVSRVRKAQGPTATGLTVILAHEKNRNILTYPGTMFEMCFEDLDLDYLKDSRHFHLASFFLHRSLRPRTAELFATMKAPGLTTSLDINDDPEDRWNGHLRPVLEYVDLLLLNERECKKLGGADDLNQAAGRLAARVPLLVVKLGERGALALRGKDSWRAEAVEVKAVDPVGAGDSFDAGFIHQFIRGADIETCLRYGNLAGAFSVTRTGGTEAFRDRRTWSNSCKHTGQKMQRGRERHRVPGKTMIDFHTHPVLIRELVEKYPRFERAAREVFYIGNNFQPLETFLLQMDAAGIERAVLLPVDCRRARQDPVGTNEQIAELCAMSPRFIGFASVDPQVKTAAKQLARAVKNLGLEGLKLDPALQDFDSAGKAALAVYEAAEDLKIPVLLHTGMSWAPGSAIERGHPLKLEPAIRRFAKLNFVLAHFAWPWVWEAAALAMKYPNVFLDTSCLYYDSPKEFFQFVFTRQIPATLIERTLRNQVVFGSNYPRVEIKNMVHALKSLPLTEGCLNKILKENAEKLLGKSGK